jgi:hypothetical protein
MCRIWKMVHDLETFSELGGFYFQIVQVCKKLTGGWGSPPCGEGSRRLETLKVVDESPRYGENTLVGDTLCRKRAFL